MDFYREPLTSCWYEAGETEELRPVQALAIKRQIVLFGPPGTGKTHEAKVAAETLLRQGILRMWKAKRYFTDQNSVKNVVSSRIRRIQMHPGYGYEDLIRGLHLVDGGKTQYRNGVLLQIIADIAKQLPEERDLPFVIILDEMNRADLSKVLGECFSLLEDRAGEIQLAGQDIEPCLVRMPSNLYFIGTMNLIDQSLEQVDFALRRRFLWFFRGFERADFLTIAKYRWDELHQSGELRKPWEKFEEEFDMLADRAESLNTLIKNHHSLGPNYQIGHTYFCDVVSFARNDLAAKPSRQRLLFNKKNQAIAPVDSLWKYSLRPLLEQYLSGVDGAERDEILRQVASNASERGLMKGGGNQRSTGITATDLSPIVGMDRDDEDWLRELARNADSDTLSLSFVTQRDVQQAPIVSYDSQTGTWWAGRFVGELTYQGRTLTILPRFGMPALRRG